MSNGKLFFNDDFDNEFANVSMWDQLGKILDSKSASEVVDVKRFRAVNTVKTDDGVTMTVTAREAQKIKDVLLCLKTPVRATVIKQLQMSRGMTNMLSMVQKTLEKQIMKWDPWDNGNIALIIGALVVLTVTVPHLIVWLIQ